MSWNYIIREGLLTFGMMVLGAALGIAIAEFQWWYTKKSRARNKDEEGK